MLLILEHFADQDPVEPEACPSTRENKTGVRVGPFVLKMHVVFVDECYLDWLKQIFESFEDQEAPVRRQTHHLPEIREVICQDRGTDHGVKHAVFTSEFENGLRRRHPELAFLSDQRL